MKTAEEKEPTELQKHLTKKGFPSLAKILEPQPKDWSKRFDENFGVYYYDSLHEPPIQESAFTRDSNPDELKQFISEELKSQREEIIKYAEHNPNPMLYKMDLINFLKKQ